MRTIPQYPPLLQAKPIYATRLHRWLSLTDGIVGVVYYIEV